MKIVISPAKSLDFESPLPTDRHSEFAFAEEASRIHKVLASKKPSSLRRLMDISEDLAQLNWERNQAFSLPFTSENARPAVFAFSGDVYQGLDACSLTPGQIDRMQEVLRILSGLYGLLKPLDLIQPYRLEMGTSLKVGTRKNLYEFWKKTLTDHLNAEMGEGELLVNLASAEYFGALDAKRLKAPVVTPVFKDWSKDELDAFVKSMRKFADALENSFNLEIKLNTPFRGGHIIQSHSIEMPWFEFFETSPLAKENHDIS